MTARRPKALEAWTQAQRPPAGTLAVVRAGPGGRGRSPARGCPGRVRVVDFAHEAHDRDLFGMTGLHLRLASGG